MTDIVGFVNGLLNGFLHLILDFIINIVNIILLPIDLLINNFLPDFSNLIGYISNALNVSLNYIGWVIDSIGLDNITLVFIIDYLIFKLTIPLQSYIIKLAVKWYNNLKT